MHKLRNKYILDVILVFILIYSLKAKNFHIRYEKFFCIKKFIFSKFILISYFFRKKYLKFKFYSLTNQIYWTKQQQSLIKIKPSTLMTLLYYLYVFTISLDLVEIYFSIFLFLITTLVKLIKITDYWINNKILTKNFPIFHSIIKYTLFILLTINIIVLIIIGQKLVIIIATYLKKFFVNMDFKNKLKDLKLSWDYKWVKNNGKKPQKPEEIFSFLDFKNKKKKQKKAYDLKLRIFEAQQKQKNIYSTTLQQESFSNKRNWKRNINIENNPKFTISDQLNNIKSEFRAYDNQEKKFKKIVVDINKKKESFFPDESKSLFNEYISVVKILKKNLKSVEKTLSKNKS